MINRIKSVAVRFANDEQGMEAVQIIMTIAIAAMVCLGVSKISGVNASGATDSGLMGKIGEIGGKFLGDSLSGLFS
ncbi:hypothetical protein SH528x_000096 [Novipirellula sp. SH528]|uniref:hypothetical protein n=1 Tax=Novipirellula sp. SH528 TaxID=3454466 RepID=UPI003F9FA814